jgi:hypothetical protein
VTHFSSAPHTNQRCAGHALASCSPKIQTIVFESSTTNHGEKSGKHKFAFAWNLLGGAPTQGHGRARKEISLHGAAHIGTRQPAKGISFRQKLTAEDGKKVSAAGVFIQVRDALRPSIHYHPPSHAAGGT